MRIKVSILFGVAILAAGLVGMARSEVAGPPLTTAMFDTYACQYEAGHGPADLAKVVADWNAWMQTNDAEASSAWTWTPYYFGPDETADFIWVGVATNAETLERGHDQWLAKGGEIKAKFDKVARCDTHFNFAATNFRPTPPRPDAAAGVVTLTGCDIAKGKNFADVTRALKIWTDYVIDAGSVRGMWVLRRAYGSGDDAADFKWINSFPTLAALGADYDRFRTRGDNKARELFGNIFKCGATSVYSTATMRVGISDEQYKLN
jgi:hypothetical protein